MTNSVKLETIDSLTYDKHFSLEESDIGKCFYWRKRTSEGYSTSNTHQLIQNIKIPNTEKHRLHHKQNAIAKVAEEMVKVIKNRDHVFNNYTFIPIPSSKTKDHPSYHGGILSILEKIKSCYYPKMDIRELIFQKKSTTSDHTSERRQTIEELKANYGFNNGLLLPEPQKIVIFDDMLTKGCHFKAMQSLLLQKFPTIPIIGLFIARAINANDNQSKK